MGAKSTLGAASVLAGAVKNAPAGKTWGQRIRSIPSMIKDTLAGRWTGASRFGVTMSLLGLLYVVSPLDLIPDFLLPFGLIDDLGIAALSVAYLVRNTDAYLDDEAVAVPTQPGKVWVERDAETGTVHDVVEGEVIREGNN